MNIILLKKKLMNVDYTFQSREVRYYRNVLAASGKVEFYRIWLFKPIFFLSILLNTFSSRKLYFS